MPPSKQDFAALVHSPVDLRDELLAYAEAAQTQPGIPFGIPSIDKIVIPMRPGNLVCFIGRPGMGKSSMLAYLARHEAKRIVARGKQFEEAVVYVTWESSAEELEAFFQADEHVSVSDIAWGRADMEYLKQKAQSRPSLPIWVIGHGIGKMSKNLPRMTLESVLKALETMHEDYGVKPTFMLFDYLQLIPVPRAADRIEQVTEAPVRVKELAQRVGVPAVCGVQARQEVDRSKDKMPQLSDAQWSSAIGQIADKAFSLMRPIVYYSAGDKIEASWLPNKPMLEVTDTLLIMRLLKQRMEQGHFTWALHFDPRYLTLAERELHQREPPVLDWEK